MQFDIFTASIVAVPAIYGAFLGFRFVSGLTALWQRPIASTAPESTATDHIATADQMEDFWASPCEVESVATPPAANCDQAKPIALLPAAVSCPVAMLPAFVPNQQQPDYSEADRQLVETHSRYVARYWQGRPTDNVMPFVRPVSGIQKPQQAHPAIAGMSLRKMRELGARLKIRNARRWNTQQAIEALTQHYSSTAHVA